MSARARLAPVPADAANAARSSSPAPARAAWRDAAPLPAGPRRDLVRLLARLYVDELEGPDERESRM